MEEESEKRSVVLCRRMERLWDYGGISDQLPAKSPCQYDPVRNDVMLSSKDEHAYTGKSCWKLALSAVGMDVELYTAEWPRVRSFLNSDMLNCHLAGTRCTERMQ